MKSKPIDVVVPKWKQVRFEGNYKCPKCRTPMFFSSFEGQGVHGGLFLAFCPKCKKYYESVEQVRP